MLSDAAVDVLFVAVPLLPVLYLVLQIAAVIRMRGWLRVAASACGLVMLGLVLYVGVASGVMGSNLAPILIVLALPLLTPVLIVLWLIHALRPWPPCHRA